MISKAYTTLYSKFLLDPCGTPARQFNVGILFFLNKTETLVILIFVHCVSQISIMGALIITTSEERQPLSQEWYQQKEQEEWDPGDIVEIYYNHRDHDSNPPKF